MEEIVQSFFNGEIARDAMPIVLQGLLNTILLSLLVVPLGLLGGLALAVMAHTRKPWLRWPLMAWVDFFRAFPPLVLLIFLYAALPFAGIEFGAFGCVAIGFFLNTGSYYGEILRAGIDSVPAGQVEAARSTGLGRLQAMTYIVLPQAVRPQTGCSTRCPPQCLPGQHLAQARLHPPPTRRGQTSDTQSQCSSHPRLSWTGQTACG